MRTLRTVLLAAILITAASTAASDEIPLTPWPSPLLWQPAAAVSPHVADPTSGPGRQALALPSSPLPFVAITPCRQYDSRSQSALPDNTPRTVTLTGAPCNLSATAQAAAVNITVFGITGAGSNGVFKVGVSSPPTTAWINYPPTETQRANAGVVALTDAGAIVVQVNQGAGSVHFVVDVNGYYAPAGIVNSVNTLSGDVTLSPGSNVSITPSGNTLTIAAAAGGGPPSGPAGGSLTGTYPNPGIASGAVGATQLANSTTVRSINGAAQDLVTIQGSGAVSVGTAGSTLTIGAPSGSLLLGDPGDTNLVGAGYTEVAANAMGFWTATATAGAPAGRYGHSAVWTGTRMIVWGGTDESGFYLNDGGQYDPASDSWTGTSASGAPQVRLNHTAVWTGSKMVVWGGQGAGGIDLNDGGQYDPAGDSWTATSTSGAPTARRQHTAVWAGTRMVVWGGIGSGLYLNSGGRYDPAGNSWAAMTVSGAPQGRYDHTAVWTGTRMIVWGGSNAGGALNDGGQYNPSGNSWTATTTSGAPSGRYAHAAVWTGSTMVVWGGYRSGYLGDGGQYDPAGDSWTATAASAAPAARGRHTAVWTGARMVVWGGIGSGGYMNDGGLYDPAGGSWTATATSGTPATRWLHTTVWTGTRMLVWGGRNDPAYLNDGGQYQSISLYRKN